MKRLFSLVLLLTLLLCLAGCSSVPEADLSRLPEVEGVDFKGEIETFVEDSLNTQTLSPGETHKAQGHIWVSGGNGACYSSDTSVVTVSANGTVKAVAPGTAYVLVQGATSMYRITKYKVSDGFSLPAELLLLGSPLLIFLVFGGLTLAIPLVIFFVVFSQIRKGGFTRRRQTPAQSKAAKEAFGKGGEDNVWHNLKSLPDLGNYQIYRNVKIPGKLESSQIDAIVVSESGVFLLEVKSLGGDRLPDGSHVVRFHHFHEDPSSQLLRHHFAFINLFPELQLNDPIYSDVIQDVLVISYPHTEKRRMVDLSSFPPTSYPVVQVDQLLEFFRSRQHGGIYGSMMDIFAQKLKPLSGAHYISRQRHTPSSPYPSGPAAAPIQTPTVATCRSCGNVLPESGSFCPHCGTPK